MPETAPFPIMQQDHTQALQALKEQIWALCKQSLVNVQVAADKAKVTLPITTIAQGEAVMRVLKPKRKKKVKAEVPDWIKQRYRDAKYAYEDATTKHWIKDGHFIEPDYPDVNTSNGLTDYITEFLNWSFHRATRITTEGRAIEKNGKTIRIPTKTRNGTADISSTICGKPCMIEIKIGRDRPSPAQLKEQLKERRAGGVYEFISTAEQFLQWYDQFILVNRKQGFIFEL